MYELLRNLYLEFYHVLHDPNSGNCQLVKQFKVNNEERYNW